jgi:MoxR-like ATPase
MNKNFLKFQENALKTMGGKWLPIERALIVLLSGRHGLLEDIPGVGKTTLVLFLAKMFGLDFKRVQFTHDLLPSDILGAHLLNLQTSDFTFRKGPVFTEMLLADELNRAPAKTQAALLQCMEEGVVSSDGKNYELSPLFCVFATQNPFGMLGTFPLPESQLDRFMMKFSMGFPEPDEEKKIIQQLAGRDVLDSLDPCFNQSQLKEMQTDVQKIFVAEELLNYVLRLLTESREKTQFYRPLSPRCGQDLILGAKARAYLLAREYVTAQDIKDVFIPVVSHRLSLQQSIIANPSNGEDSLALKLLNSVSVL